MYDCIFSSCPFLSGRGERYKGGRCPYGFHLSSNIRTTTSSKHQPPTLLAQIIPSVITVTVEYLKSRLQKKKKARGLPSPLISLRLKRSYNIPPYNYLKRFPGHGNFTHSNTSFIFAFPPSQILSNIMLHMSKGISFGGGGQGIEACFSIILFLLLRPQPPSLLSCSLLFSFVKSDSPDMNCHVPRPIIIGYSAETGPYRVSGPTMGEFLGKFSFSVGNEEGRPHLWGYRQYSGVLLCAGTEARRVIWYS